MSGFQSERVWLLIFSTLILDGLAGLAGGLLSERWLARRQTALIGFAAGALLGAVFWDILPESVDGLGRDALSWTFYGFIALAVVEWSVGHHHHEESGHVSPTLPPTLLISDALHNIGDGATIAAAFLVSIQAGIAVAIAVIAHEIPQEVGDYALLRAAGWKRARALLGLAIVQLTAFLGAAGVILAAERFKFGTAIVLSIAAGTFLYIAATDLLPEIRVGRTPSERRQRMLGFAAGLGVMAFVSNMGTTP
ncbi:MAG TPA: ZIP family metal transporter [Terriglobia bacterium]|nr:ZIP family metal transporter [Terriglobia bacterium]